MRAVELAAQGQRAQLAFYRDQRGTEIDLVLEHVRAPLAVEIKSGQLVWP